MFKRILCVLLLALCLAPLANGATIVCVTDAAGLQAALNGAVDRTVTTYVQIARGTYHLAGNELSFSNTANANQGQLDLTGGYSSDCSTHINNPALTILDGDGMSLVMSVASGGGISVRYLTFQNGSFYPGGLHAESTLGGVIVAYNIFRNSSDAGLWVRVGDGNNASGALHVVGNLIIGNSSGGGNNVKIENFGAGNTYITNNTIADNISTDVHSPGGMDLSGSTFGGSTNLSNNIAWGNTFHDLTLSSGTPVLVNNDYGSAVGSFSSIGNVTVNPQFVAAGDYHLAATSPLLGTGTLTPVGGLPTIDIEGHPRSYNGFVDIGAYEHGDKIFAYNFDD